MTALITVVNLMFKNNWNGIFDLVSSLSCVSDSCSPTMEGCLLAPAIA